MSGYKRGSISVPVIMRVLSVGDVALRYADAVRVGVVSASKVTVTEKIAIPTFPNASDAVQVTIVVPTGKLEPEDG